MINLTINANIIDITQDIPTNNDKFLIDTNVWYWLTYSKCSQCLRTPYLYQATDYPCYINKALISKSEIYYSPFSLAELCHLIEKAEYEIFALSQPNQFPNPKKFDKNFRHFYHPQYNPEIIAACRQVISLSSPLHIDLNTAQINYFLSLIANNRLDGYDLYILQSMSYNNVYQIITDDSDYATVSNINVFTANKNIINQAKSSGKLVCR